jgi:hypothetical protein
MVQMGHSMLNISQSVKFFSMAPILLQFAAKLEKMLKHREVAYFGNRVIVSKIWVPGDRLPKKSVLQKSHQLMMVFYKLLKNLDETAGGCKCI